MRNQQADLGQIRCGNCSQARGSRAGRLLWLLLDSRNRKERREPIGYPGKEHSRQRGGCTDLDGGACSVGEQRGDRHGRVGDGVDGGAGEGEGGRRGLRCRERPDHERTHCSSDSPTWLHIGITRRALKN